MSSDVTYNTWLRDLAERREAKPDNTYPLLMIDNAVLADDPKPAAVQVGTITVRGGAKPTAVQYDMRDVVHGMYEGWQIAKLSRMLQRRHSRQNLRILRIPSLGILAIVYGGQPSEMVSQVTGPPATYSRIAIPLPELLQLAQVAWRKYIELAKLVSLSTETSSNLNRPKRKRSTKATGPR